MYKKLITSRIFSFLLILFMFGFLNLNCPKDEAEPEEPPPYIVEGDLGTMEENWREVNNGIPNEEGFYPTPLCFAFTENKEVFMGTEDFGVFYSDDAGESWQETIDPIGASVVYDLFWIDGKLLAATNNGIIATEDNGSFWYASGMGIPQNSIANDITDGSEYFPGIYASVDNKVYKSIDNGNSWLDFSDGLPPNAIVRCTQPHLGMMLAGLAGSDEVTLTSPIYKRSENDEEWIAITYELEPNPPDLTYVSITSLLSIKGDILAAQTYFFSEGYHDTRIIYLTYYTDIYGIHYFWKEYMNEDPAIYMDFYNRILAKGGANGDFLAGSFMIVVHLSVYQNDDPPVEGYVHHTYPRYNLNDLRAVTALNAANGIDQDWYTTYFAGVRNSGVFKRGHVYMQ